MSMFACYRQPDLAMSMSTFGLRRLPSLAMPPAPHASVGWAFTLRSGGVSQGPWGPWNTTGKTGADRQAIHPDSVDAFSGRTDLHSLAVSRTRDDAGTGVEAVPATAGGLNLGIHCGDDPVAAQKNRRRVAEAIGMPVSWLKQVHGIRVLDLDSAEARARMIAAARPGNHPGNSSAEVPFDGTPAGETGQAHGVVSGANLHRPEPSADAQITTLPGIVLAVQVADCLPVLLADTQGRVIGAAHAGWRGLAGGVLEATVQAMREKVPDADIVAWLGPCIGPAAFEVGDDVRAAFLDIPGYSAAPATIRPASTTMSGSSHLPDSQTSEGGAPFDMVRQSVTATPNITPPHQEVNQPASTVSAFQPGRAPGKWLANLPLLARLRLQALGVTTIHTAGHCTYSEPEHFWSYRRSTPCGRMAGLIWLMADRFPPPIGTLRHHAG